MSILAQFLTDQLSPSQHIAPLVISAEFHITIVFLEHVVEVVGLHDHVVELQEGQSLLHTLLIALCTKHIVDRETSAYLTEQIDVV